MPGAWEYKPPEVLVGILTRGIVPTKWAIGYRNLNLPPSGRPTFFSGMPFDHARNVACKATLDGGFTWLLFLDDDVVPPADAFYRLSSHGLDIVSGLYYRRNDPILPVALRDTAPKPEFITNFTPGELIEADLVGAGCLLILRRVLERMPRPWFEWLLDREDLQEGEKASEDFAFCRKAKRQYGFYIYVDTLVQCTHVGYGCSELGGRFAPLAL